MCTLNNPNGYVFSHMNNCFWEKNNFQRSTKKAIFEQFRQFVEKYIELEKLSTNHPLQLYLSYDDVSINDSNETKFCRMIIAIDDIINNDKYNFNSILNKNIYNNDSQTIEKLVIFYKKTVTNYEEFICQKVMKLFTSNKTVHTINISECVYYRLNSNLLCEKFELIENEIQKLFKTKCDRINIDNQIKKIVSDISKNLQVVHNKHANTIPITLKELPIDLIHCVLDFCHKNSNQYCYIDTLNQFYKEYPQTTILHKTDPIQYVLYSIDCKSIRLALQVKISLSNGHITNQSILSKVPSDIQNFILSYLI